MNMPCLGDKMHEPSRPASVTRKAHFIPRTSGRIALVLTLLFLFINADFASAQCDNFSITNVSTWTECRGNSMDGYEVVQVNHVSWSGGTAPFQGSHYPGGGFDGNGYALWESIVATADGVSSQFTPDAYLIDANGCAVSGTGQSGIQYWVHPEEQVYVSTSVWDAITGTATVMLVDNPTDPGVQLPYDPDVGYWLNCTSDPMNDRVGLAVEIYLTGPQRYGLSQLPPGNYEFWLQNVGFPGVSSAVPCEGMALAFTVQAPSPTVISVAPRVVLAGAWNPSGASMNDGLRSSGLVPATEPYAALGYGYVGTHGPATISNSVLQVTGLNAIVDWVVVELRSAPGTVVASRAALLQRDGDVVGTDGSSAVTFSRPPGNYFVAVHHRNHLGIMSAAPLALSSSATAINFTTPATATYGTNARQNISGVMAMWPGDGNGNGTVQYTGTGNDRDPVLVAIGGSVASNTVTNVYSRLDINMNGTISYTGLGNDRDVILQTIGGTVASATRVEQVP